MSNVRWIGRMNGENQGGDLNDALAYVNSLAADPDDSDGVIVVRFDSNGCIHMKAFGEAITVSDVALAGAMLTKRACAHVDGEEIPGEE